MRQCDAFTCGSFVLQHNSKPECYGLFTDAMIAVLRLVTVLPLTYQKDMQEDKVPVFEAADALGLCLAATTGLVRDMDPPPGRPRARARARFQPRHRSRRWARARPRAAVPPRAPYHR